MKRCILSCECPYCGLQRPESQSYFLITARGVMHCLFVHRRLSQSVGQPGAPLPGLGNKVSVYPEMPCFTVDAAHIVDPFVTHLQSSARRRSGAYASRITNTLINKSPNPISPAELNSHQLERRQRLAFGPPGQTEGEGEGEGEAI